MAARAGGPVEVGRGSDGLVQPMTRMFRVAEFSHEAFASYAREHPDQWYCFYPFWDDPKRQAEAQKSDN